MDIKNIIKKAYLDGIIEGQVIAKVNMNFDTEGMSEHYAETELKKLRVTDVSNRRELLIAFMESLTIEDLTQIEIAEFDNVANKFLGN
jgi:hypothetical protein